MEDYHLPGSRIPSPEIALVLGFFFFNTLGLPGGLLYTTLLTPWFMWQLWLNRQGRRLLLAYLVLSLPLLAFHLARGAESGVYFQSYLLFTSAVVFTGWCWQYLQPRLGRLGQYARYIALYNTFLTAIALLVKNWPGLQEYFWYFVPIHAAIEDVPRLKMLVYEPSFYSLQLAPLFLYFFLGFFLLADSRYLPGLLLLSLSLGLSLSFGVLGGLALAIGLVLLIHTPALLRRKHFFFTALYLLALAALAGFAIVVLFPLNPMAERLEFIVAGNDSSANGRTWEAFLLAWRILEKTSYLFGAGLGQVKIVGHDIIVNYYDYDGAWADLVRLPNTLAETLATFGLLGALARLLAQVVLFVYTKVYTNFYRMALFAFLFIYQFTGSYLTNIYEYLAWVLVFVPVYTQFDKRNVFGA